MTKRITVFIAALLAAFAVGAGASVLAHLDTDEPVKDGGGGIVKFAPGETLPALGTNGEPIVCDDGMQLQVDPVRDDPPGDLVRDRQTDPATLKNIEGAVPRCGPDGGGPNAEPIWVPESVGEQHPQNAPMLYVEDQSK
ncbi:MAG: hypothetical protein ACRDMA_00315 [Solirubrobacterales bacterium]